MWAPFTVLVNYQYKECVMFSLTGILYNCLIYSVQRAHVSHLDVVFYGYFMVIYDVVILSSGIVQKDSNNKS